MITVNLNNYPDKADLQVVRGDTKKLVFAIKTGTVAEDISDWTNFYLTVDTQREPSSTNTNVAELIGAIVSGVDGTVAFTPDVTLDAGNYYFDIQAENADAEVITLMMGKFKVLQDITKI